MYTEGMNTARDSADDLTSTASEDGSIESGHDDGRGWSFSSQQFDSRAAEFASVFSRMLSLHRGTEIYDRFVVMMIKVCDYVEDIFEFVSPQVKSPWISLMWLSIFAFE